MNALLYSYSLRIFNAKRLQIIFRLPHPIAMTLSSPKLSDINQRLFVRYEIFTSVEILWISAVLGMKMKKWLIEARSFYVHLIDFIYQDGLIILLSLNQ